MGRTRNRLSRGLIGILTITIALGFVAYIHNTTKSNASEKPKVTSALASASTGKEPPITEPSDKGVVVSSAPKTEISIAPAPINKPAPATKPATQPAASPLQRAGLKVTNAPTPTKSTTPLADAKAKFDAGDLLASRRILSSALVSGSLAESDAAQAKSILNDINAAVVFSPKRFADDEYGGTYSVQPGELLQKIAAQHDITWQYLCRVNGLSDPKKLRAGATIKVLKGPFHAQVDKRKFTMEIWVGGEPYTRGASYVTSFPVGLGKDDSTPTGKWLIQPGNKIKNPTYYSPRGEGVIEAGDPKNPLGQCWMGLAGIDGHAVGKSSYGIHGTIDPTSIGKQESMGCIRMKNEDVAQVFELLVEGKSTVTVKD